MHHVINDGLVVHQEALALPGRNLSYSSFECIIQFLRLFYREVRGNIDLEEKIKKNGEKKKSDREKKGEREREGV